MTVDNIPTDWIEKLNNYLKEPIKQAVLAWEIDLITAITEQANIYDRIDVGMQQIEQGLTMPADKTVENIINNIDNRTTTF